MIHNSIQLLVFGGVMILAGCASDFDDRSQADSQTKTNLGSDVDVCVSKTGQVIDCATPQFGQLPTRQDDTQVYPNAMQYSHPLEASHNTVLVGEYIEQMATDILANLTIPVREAVVGVTSFVEFSEDLSSVNHFGNMLAESFIFELQQNGIPVVDYKVSDRVKVMPNGDYVFSRNPAALNLTSSMSHVLTGTITYNKRGLVINARMVNYENKRVVSASKKIIPYFILDSIIPSHNKNAIIGE